MTKLDVFAEALAEGLSVAEAGAAVGWNKYLAIKMLSDLRKRLGWQAQ